MAYMHKQNDKDVRESGEGEIVLELSSEMKKKSTTNKLTSVFQWNFTIQNLYLYLCLIKK